MHAPDQALSPAIQFRDVGYTSGQQQILRGVSFSVPVGSTLILLGRSGAGKTTALKLINRLLLPTSGEVLVSGRSTLDWNAITLRRSIGYVIQESGLFPHLTLARNVAVVPRLERWPEQRVRARVQEMFEVVGLDAGELSARYPHQVSGGQRQRVGVARALAADPKILLMDEPFGALDPITRAELQQQFLQLQARLRKTVVIVTHDLREALTLGTHVALFEQGELAGIFSPAEFVSSPHPSAVSYMAPFREASISI